MNINKTCVAIIFMLFVAVKIMAQFKDVREISVEKAQQGVAVDSSYFYVINNFTITKHIKSSGKKVADWSGEQFGLKHLNAGIIIDNKLYCVHSNYPALPMVSSVEIFDPKTLKHIDTHSFGISYGSITWIDYRDNSWWVVFANYNKEGYYFPNTWTVLVQFSEKWEQLQSWTFPAELVKKFGNMSCSGGFWVNDDFMYMTGHDLQEFYQIRLPKMGSVLVWDNTFTVPIEGQGVAVDKSKTPYVYYGIDRKNSQIIEFTIDK